MAEKGIQDALERDRHFGKVKGVTLMTVLSRVAGMLRASAIASLGATAMTDAFSFAWGIPNLFRRLFAEGAMTSAFVPVFTEVQEGPGGRQKADRLLANSMGILALFLTALTMLIQAGLLAWAVLAPGPLDRQLFIGLTVGGWMGWWLGERFGIMTAFILSTLGSISGVILGWRIGRSHFS